MNLHKLIFTNNACYKAGRRITPKGIMVHSTGANNPWLKRYVGPDDGLLGKNQYNNHWNQPMDREVCVHAFIGKLADGTVATYFGSKVWHSTDKYRRTIWRCNSKFTGEEKCQTPHLTEEEIKARFLDAFNALVSDKERLLDECRTMQAALTDTGSLDSEIAALLSEMEVVAELTKRCIEENSTTAQDQTAYLERYNGLAERYETAKAKLEKLQAAKAQREAKAEDIGGFMFELAEYGESLTEFDDRLWLTVIDTVTVHRDGQLTFKFQTGHEMLE